MDTSSLLAQLAEAKARILKLEQELSDRDRELEAVITDCDKDIVDLRKSFEIESLRKSQVISNPKQNFPCPTCTHLKEEIHKYQQQWTTISQHFHQVPGLLDSMITRTDNLVNNISRIGS